MQGMSVVGNSGGCCRRPFRQHLSKLPSRINRVNQCGCSQKAIGESDRAMAAITPCEGPLQLTAEQGSAEAAGSDPWIATA